MIVNNNLAISIFGHIIVLDALPPDLRGTNKKIVPAIGAVSQEYLLFAAQRTREEMQSKNLGVSVDVFVHDRTRNIWKTIQVEGNSPALRIFGPWLTTIVKNYDPNHGSNPGRQNERLQGTDRLPAVQMEYSYFQGRLFQMPGILILQNLQDNRKIRIETGQEDSEILNVMGDMVLYRVNDTIYQARIAGNQLQGTSVVVKDDDVPEIHWVFWGPAVKPGK